MVRDNPVAFAQVKPQPLSRPSVWRFSQRSHGCIRLLPEFATMKPPFASIAAIPLFRTASSGLSGLYIDRDESRSSKNAMMRDRAN
jgi:hypothetical protein